MMGCLDSFVDAELFHPAFGLPTEGAKMLRSEFTNIPGPSSDSELRLDLILNVKSQCVALNQSIVASISIVNTTVNAT